MPAQESRCGQMGFAWTELLVTLALLGLLAAGLAPVLWIGVEGYDEVRRREALHRQIRLALDRLLRDVQASHRVRTGGVDELVLDVQSTSGEVLHVRWERDPSDGLLYWQPGAEPRSPVAGPFRRFEAQCYASGSEVRCGNSAREVAVTLQAGDPEGVVPDVTVQGRAWLRVQR